MAFQASADKIDEAQHFLVLMQVAEMPPDDRGVPARLQGEDAFRFAFSAFVSATRTVLYLLQEEGASVPGFTRWYVTARERWLKSELALFFADRRHFRLVFPSGVAEVVLPPSAMAPGRPGAGAPPTETPGQQVPSGQVRFADRSDESATELCARHLESLTAVVLQARQLAA